MERGSVTQELGFFIVFFFGGLLLWSLSISNNPSRVPDLFLRVLDLDVKAILISLGPYLLFQLVRVTFFGLGRKV
jgi:hypothetical protein